MAKSKGWALVTGAAKGLGAEICRTLAKSGYSLVIHYYKSQDEALALKTTCASYGVDCVSIQGNFCSTESVNAFLDAVKSLPVAIGVLVNNVGSYAVNPPLASSDQEWKELFQSNLHAPVAIIRSLLPTIIEQKGAIINIGVAGISHVPADVYSTAYTAAKLALFATSKALAKELASTGVRVNMVSPGILENTVDMEKLKSLLPLRRPGELLEVARVIDFLLDEKSCYITGQNIEVAGGVRLL